MYELFFVAMTLHPHRYFMKKLLVATVGGAVPAVKFAIESHHPDYILLLTTPGSEERNIPELLVLLRTANLDTIPCEQCCIGNENDAQHLFQRYLDEIEKCKQRLGDDVELAIDFTSGTKAMTAALFAAGVALNSDQVFYVYSEHRDKLGRAVQSDRIMAFAPIFAIAERELAEARRLFNEADYANAARLAMSVHRSVIDKIDKKDVFVSRTWTIWQLGQAYAAWDAFEWEKAAKTIRENMKNVLLPDGEKERLCRQVEFCDTIAANEYAEERLFDLYANAQRRWTQKRHDDALSRLYRAFEYMIQVELRKECGIDSSKTSTQEIRERCPKIHESTLSRFQGDEYERILKIGLRSGLVVLAEFGNRLGTDLAEAYFGQPWVPGNEQPNHSGSLKGLLENRNRSYLAHGSEPVKQATVTGLMDILKKLLVQKFGEKHFETLLETATFVKIGPRPATSK